MIYTTDDFVAELTGLFYPPMKWTPEQEQNWARHVTTECGAFEGEVLRRAARDIIRNRGGADKSLPLPADCLKACREAKRWLKAEEEKSQLPLGPQAQSPEWSAERVKLAYDLCRTALGKRAAKEGWSYRLWNHCRLERQHPPAAMCDQWQREAREHQALVEACVRGEGGAFSPQLAKLGQSMLDRESKKAAEILGG